ncbi:MAG: thiamine phosphate synthase [Bacteroides sp.]|nr:thiamine phosphate synthase [Bacteroides sp.]
MEDKRERPFSTDRPGLIAITPEEPVADEGAKIAALLRGGFARVHLRHPQAQRRDMQAIIESVPPEFHSALVLHGHFDLVHDFNLGGLHLNHRCPTPPAGYRGSLSRSCHSLEELKDAGEYAYVTLSPIFDSVSKAGYRGQFNIDQLLELPSLTDVAVVALGGITPEKMTMLRGLPFSGYAMLGAIPWQSTVEEIKLFAESTVKLLD